MKAAKDAGEEHYDPTREDNILGRNKTRLALREEHFKGPIFALDKALKCVWDIRVGGLGPSAWWKDCLAKAGVGFLQSLWGKASDGQCVFTRSVHGVENGDEAGSEDESASSNGSREGNVSNDRFTSSGCMGLVARSPFS